MVQSNKGLGRLADPIKCSGERGMRLYVCALLDEQGLPLTILRRDQYIVEGKQLEVVDLTASDGQVQSIYFDTRHTGYHEQRLIEGFKTQKDFIKYKEFTDVRYFNKQLQSIKAPEDFTGYFNLWKNCGVLLSFGPGFYASYDREAMPLPVFKMSELMAAASLVVHNLAGLTPDMPLPFSQRKFLMEFLVTFYYELNDFNVYPSSARDYTQRVEATGKYECDTLVLWVDVPVEIQ
jgi:hypothetical protein